MTGFIIAAAAFIAVACFLLYRQNKDACDYDNAIRAYYEAKRKYYEKRKERKEEG